MSPSSLNPQDPPKEIAEGFLSAVLASTDDAILSKTLDETITSWNPAAERMFGYSASEIIGKSFTLLVPPSHLHEVSEIETRLKRGEVVDHLDTIRVRKDGQSLNVRLRIAPIRNKEGAVVGTLEISHDVSESREKDNALRLSEERFSQAFEHAPIGMALVAPNGKWLKANLALCELIGYTADELYRKTFQELTHPDDLQSDLELLRQTLAGEISTYQLEKRYFHKDGHIVWIHLSVSLVRDANGHPLYFVSKIQNITENKRASEKISEQAALLDKTHDAITLRDLEGHVLFWNKGAETLFGWTAEEATGRQVRDLIFRNQVDYEEAWRITLNEDKWTGELPIIHKDGRELVVQSHWSLIRDEANQPKAILGISCDITDHKKIEAQFMRAQRMESIGTLAGGIAHDLNNILSPIMMSIDLLRQMVDKPQATQILNSIDVSAKRGADVVRQVLSFARGVEGLRIEVQPKHLVKDLERILNDTFPKDIHWQFNVPNETWSIQGDPTQIQQVLLNLCVNARDAMPRGGFLTVNVENRVLDARESAANLEAKPGPYVVISVTDTGMGIPRDAHHKIFEPFFTTKELGKGTGLGLSTVMAIVKSHKGFITVRSELGEGSNFSVFLPAQASSNLRQEAAVVESLPRGNGEIILLAEDEASILAMTSQILQTFGYHVIPARHGAEAVAIYQKKKEEIAVVITDMMMPVMDGEATISALLAINPKVRIIAASGIGSYATLAKLSNIGVKHFLPKPHTAGALLQTLQKILKNGKQHPPG
jgi:PAS domain S-box-containing protein